MVSLVALEVNCVVIPAMGIFLLYVASIPVLSKMIAFAVKALERPNISGFTLLTALAIVSSLAFLSDFLQWQSTYGTSKPRFSDISLSLQYETKRLRVERNMYIHILCSVLALTLKKFNIMNTIVTEAKRD